jgi:hypothetical protein
MVNSTFEQGLKHCLRVPANKSHPEKKVLDYAAKGEHLYY